MQIFNKRTWQLVLGAGALQTVGLKSITAKHLGTGKGNNFLVKSLLLSYPLLSVNTFSVHFQT
jgi:hypothetical protein